MLPHQPYRRAQPDATQPAQHDQPADSSHPPRAIRVAVIGRPNVGKSTFVNAASEGSRQLLVGPEPGITRDCIDVRSCWCFYYADDVRDAKLRFLSSGTAARSSSSTQQECAGSNARSSSAIKNCNIAPVSPASDAPTPCPSERKWSRLGTQLSKSRHGTGERRCCACWHGEKRCTCTGANYCPSVLLLCPRATWWCSCSTATNRLVRRILVSNRFAIRMSRNAEL
jgi:hypothetical protein